jgi:hypothetical protein
MLRKHSRSRHRDIFENCLKFRLRLCLAVIEPPRVHSRNASVVAKKRIYWFMGFDSTVFFIYCHLVNDDRRFGIINTRWRRNTFHTSPATYGRCETCAKMSTAKGINQWRWSHFQVLFVGRRRISKGLTNERLSQRTSCRIKNQNVSEQQVKLPNDISSINHWRWSLTSAIACACNQHSYITSLAGDRERVRARYSRRHIKICQICHLKLDIFLVFSCISQQAEIDGGW